MSRLIALLAVIPVLIIVAYVVHANPASRVELFAALSSAWLGAWEIVVVLRELVIRRRFSRGTGRHALIGVGAWLIADAITRGMPTVLFTVGSLLCTVGFLIPEIALDPVERR
jgi:hypothetical protein